MSLISPRHAHVNEPASTSSSNSIDFPILDHQGFTLYYQNWTIVLVRGSVGGLVDKTTPMICGGVEVPNTCFKLESGVWMSAQTLVNPRTHSVGIPFSPFHNSSHKFFITGLTLNKPKLEESITCCKKGYQSLPAIKGPSTSKLFSWEPRILKFVWCLIIQKRRIEENSNQSIHSLDINYKNTIALDVLKSRHFLSHPKGERSKKIMKQKQLHYQCNFDKWKKVKVALVMQLLLWQALISVALKSQLLLSNLFWRAVVSLFSNPNTILLMFIFMLSLIQNMINIVFMLKYKL